MDQQITYEEEIKSTIAHAENEIQGLDITSRKYQEQRIEIIKGMRGSILTTKRIYLSNELRRISKLDSVSEQESQLKSMINNLFITAKLGTKTVPAHFMELYLSKQILIDEIAFEVFREKGLYNNLAPICSKLISQKSNKDSEVDYATAIIISNIRQQDFLDHCNNYYLDCPQINITANCNTVAFDRDSLIIYEDMLQNVVKKKILNHDDEILQKAITYQSQELSEVQSIYHYEYNHEIGDYEEVEDTIYACYGSEFEHTPDKTILKITELSADNATLESEIKEAKKAQANIEIAQYQNNQKES